MHCQAASLALRVCGLGVASARASEDVHTFPQHCVSAHQCQDKNLESCTLEAARYPERIRSELAVSKLEFIGAGTLIQVFSAAKTKTQDVRLQYLAPKNQNRSAILVVKLE